MAEVPLQQLVCKNCGGKIDLRKEAGIAVCLHCGAVFTLPKREQQPAVVSYLRMGEHALDICDFEGAFSAYEKAERLDSTEPEAYFGKALSRFKVQYLADVAKSRSQPICHEVSAKCFLEDGDYLMALSLATEEQKREYEEKGREIEAIRKEFYELEKSGLDYDCFLCAKVSSEDGKGLTDDAIAANDLYYFLKDKGYKPFFSERELKGLSGIDYEARILYALYQSECMLVVCSDETFLETPWVKNEYTRFLRMLDYGDKERNSITVLFNGVPIERIPGKRGKIQGIDLKEKDAYLEVLDFVSRHTPEARRRREEEEAKKAQREEELFRRQKELEEGLKRIQELERRKEEEAAQAERIKKAQEEQEAKERAEREKREQSNQSLGKKIKDGIANAISGLFPAAQAQEQESEEDRTEADFLRRAKQETARGNYAGAKAYYTRILNRNATCAEAWWGRFLLFEKFYDEGAIFRTFCAKTAEKIYRSAEYKNARRYAQGDFRAHLSALEARLKKETERALEEEKESYRSQKGKKSELIGRKERLAQEVAAFDEKGSGRIRSFWQSASPVLRVFFVLGAVFVFAFIAVLLIGIFVTLTDLSPTVSTLLIVAACVFAISWGVKTAKNPKRKTSKKSQEQTRAEGELKRAEQQLALCQKDLDAIVARLNAFEALLKMLEVA